MHESNDPDDKYVGSPTNLKFTVIIKLNCDAVTIVAPSGQLTFNIDVPATAP